MTVVLILKKNIYGVIYLLIFAGTAAILQGDRPVGQVCVRRPDDRNGSLSDVLNDNPTCNIQGNCSAPLKSAQVGLIYVNAQAYLGNPDARKAVARICMD